MPAGIRELLQFAHTIFILLLENIDINIGFLSKGKGIFHFQSMPGSNRKTGK